MKLEDLIKSINPEIYHNLKLAIELGKWPNGQRLSEEQIGLCLQAVFHYESSNQLADNERIGFIDRSSMPEHKREKAQQEQDFQRSIAVRQLH